MIEQQNNFTFCSHANLPKKSMISILGKRKVILYTVGLVFNLFEGKCAFNNCIIECV